MNTFTRRSFLQGILALGAVAGLPLETIDTVKKFITDEPIYNPSNPAGRITINGIRYGLLGVNLERSFAEYPSVIEYKVYKVIPQEWYIDLDISGNVFNDFIELLIKPVPFVIQPEHFNFTLSGNAYIQSVTFNSSTDTKPEFTNLVLICNEVNAKT